MRSDKGIEWWVQYEKYWVRNCANIISKYADNFLLVNNAMSLNFFPSCSLKCLSKKGN